MDVLGRFYTKDVISNLLIKNIEVENPRKVVDLGVGNASLSIAAFARWTKAKFYATEIEKLKIAKIKKNLLFLNVVDCDTLDPKVSIKLKTRFGSIDIAVCNPPYLKIVDKVIYEDLFRRCNCSNFIRLKRITSEVVFFAHNLMLLNDTGELGIILSDTLISGKEYLLFRETILKNFSVKKVIQLPDRIFQKTEARTHILIMSKVKSDTNFCNLFISDLSGELSTPISVSKEGLTHRMDFQFHKFKQLRKTDVVTLKDIGATIMRGRLSHKELKELKVKYIHSTDLDVKNRLMSFQNRADNSNKGLVANAGDILLCRVGKRCVGRVALITKGSVIFSDCIYKISVPLRYKNILWTSLQSAYAKEWLIAHSHGVCSLSLSKSDLENFPVIYND